MAHYTHCCGWTIVKYSGDRSDPLEYRPISLLNIINKVFESLINKALVSHMESNDLFSDTQYGFHLARTTADLLTLITDKIYHALDKCGGAKLIALDISKALDNVWHKVLLYKLRSYGVSGKVFDIIKSFLNRFQGFLYGEHSSTFRITSGVPRGSILGPILFLIFINDLPDNLLSKVAIFNDITSLYSCLNEKSNRTDRTEHSNNLEHDLSSVSNWGSKWLVTFNSKNKTSLLIAIEIQLIFPSPCPKNLFLTLLSP